jgi:hypothetical protein
MAACQHRNDAPPFVPGVREDIFLSYAHLDNKSPGAGGNDEPIPGWVTVLRELLHQKLESLGGRHVRLWSDVKNDGTTVYKDVIKDRLSHTAVLVAIVSPAFVQSTYCSDEVATFVSAANALGGLSIEGSSRIVQVRKTPLWGPLKAAPEVSRGTEGFTFYVKKQDDKMCEFNQFSDGDGYREFLRGVDSLATSVFGVLQKLATRPSPVPAGPSRGVVYVASAVEDGMKTARDSLRRELAGRNFTVVPTGQLPEYDTRAAIQSAMSNANVVVHLVGDRYGACPEGEPLSFAHLEYALAEDMRSTRGLRQIVWVNPLTSRATQTEQWLSAIRKMGDDKGGDGLELIEKNLQDFKIDMLDIVDAAFTPPPIEKPHSVFLLCGRDDLANEYLQDMRGHIESRKISVEFPVFTGSELRRFEEEQIRANGGTIIYYGTSNDGWVEQKLRALMTADRDHPRAIYLCTPEDDLKRFKYGKRRPKFQAIDGRLVFVLGDCGPFDPKKIDDFIGLLGGGS